MNIISSWQERELKCRIISQFWLWNMYVSLDVVLFRFDSKCLCFLSFAKTSISLIWIFSRMNHHILDIYSVKYKKPTDKIWIHFSTQHNSLMRNTYTMRLTCAPSHIEGLKELMIKDNRNIIYYILMFAVYHRPFYYFWY